MKGLFKRAKKSWDRYLEKLAKENEKNFGSKPLDCCKLNKGGKKS